MCYNLVKNIYSITWKGVKPMADYEFARINYQKYAIIVFLKSYETPFSYLSQIEEELIRYKVAPCTVLFDMLLSMGNTSERFAEAHFNGIEFDKHSFCYVSISKNNELREVSMNFYRGHRETLDYSILNSAQKKLILGGLAI